MDTKKEKGELRISRRYRNKYYLGEIVMTVLSACPIRAVFDVNNGEIEGLGQNHCPFVVKK